MREQGVWQWNQKEKVTERQSERYRQENEMRKAEKEPIGTASLSHSSIQFIYTWLYAVSDKVEKPHGVILLEETVQFITPLWNTKLSCLHIFEQINHPLCSMVNRWALGRWILLPFGRIHRQRRKCSQPEMSLKLRVSRRIHRLNYDTDMRHTQRERERTSSGRETETVYESEGAPAR